MLFFPYFTDTRQSGQNGIYDIQNISLKNLQTFQKRDTYQKLTHLDDQIDEEHVKQQNKTRYTTRKYATYLYLENMR